MNLPPLTTPFVLIADIDNAVIVVTTVVVKIKIVPSTIPACATTQLRRRNSITPQIFRMHLIKTPFIQPNFNVPCSRSASGSVTWVEVFNLK